MKNKCIISNKLHIVVRKNRTKESAKKAVSWVGSGKDVDALF